MSINATRLHTIQLTYTIDGYDRCQVTSGSSITLTISTLTYTEMYELWEWWSLEQGLGSWDMEDGITFGCFLVSLFSSSLLWISARYKWRRHGFLPPANGGGVSPCTGSAKRSPLSCTTRLWHLWVRTIAYVGWLFHSLFAFPFLFSCTVYAAQEVSAWRER